MYNPIEEKRKFVQAQIQKSFNSGINVADEIDLEKAHKDGDHHPIKPWVWVSSANGGKGDWRVEGGRAHKRAGASTNSSAKSASSNIRNRITSALAINQPRLYNSLAGTKAHTDMITAVENFMKKNPKVVISNDDLVDMVFVNMDDFDEKYGELKGWDDLKKVQRDYKKALASSVTPNSVPSFDDYAKKYIEEHFKKHPNSAMTRADLIEDAKDKYNHQYGKISNNAGNSIDNGWDDKAGGYKTEPFKGAAKVDSLKAGDKLKTKSGKIYTIKSVNDNANNTVDIVIDNGSKIGGGVFAQTYNKSGYIGATKVDDNKNTTSKTQSPQDKVKTIMQQFDDTTMDEDEFDEYVDSVLGNDMGQKLRKEILNGNKSLSDKKQAYKDAVERHLGLKPQKYSEMDIKDAKKALMGKTITIKDYWGNGRGGSQDAVGKITKVYLYGSQKIPVVEITYNPREKQDIRLSDIDDGKLTNSNYEVVLDYKKVDNNTKSTPNDTRDKIAQDAGFKDYEEMRGYQDYVTMKNLLKKPSTKAGMRLLYQKEVGLYEKDNANLIKKMSAK